jgi:hypothetical protein
LGDATCTCPRWVVELAREIEGIWSRKFGAGVRGDLVYW